ncbi:Probable cysteine desulfurase, partial [Linum grandiflorum]
SIPHLQRVLHTLVHRHQFHHHLLIYYHYIIPPLTDLSSSKVQPTALPDQPSPKTKMSLPAAAASNTPPQNDDQPQIYPTFAGDGDGISPQSSGDLCSSGSESFRKLDAGVLKTTSPHKRLTWLRSQIIGHDAEFESPFGKRRITYADHTASGRSLHYIENFILTDVLPYYGNTHTCDSYVGRRTTKMAEEANAYIKQRLGGGEDDAVLFCGSGTTAAIKRLQEVMGVSVPSILRERCLTECLNENERWVVFVGPFEHHSNLLSWRQSLAEVVEIGLDDDGLLDMEALRRELESGKFVNRPIMGSFSACSNVTGICSDTRAIAELLHRHGGFACFDFAASGPYTKIDMRSGAYDGYDAVFISPHKFIGGPGTPGILLINKALYRLGSSPPSTCGGGTVDYVNGFNEQDTLYIEDIESREKGGTPPIIQTIRAALSFWIKEYITHPVIQHQEHLFIAKALKRLTPNKNVVILGTNNNTTINKIKRQAIMSFLILSTTVQRSSSSAAAAASLDMWAETGDVVGKPLHGAFVAVLLNDLFGIQARGGCACAGPYGHRLLGVDEGSSLAIRSAILKGYHGVKPGWARISFPYYMSDEEFEFILAAVEFLAIYGQRFLHLYRFDFRTGCWTLDSRGEFGDLVKKLGSKRSSSSAKNRYGAGLVSEFSSYLELAKKIAGLLPKFPSEREIPQDLDRGILHFRV